MKRKKKSADNTNSSDTEETSLNGSVNEGELLTDLRGNQWKLGPIIGVGGFGEVYLASNNLSAVVNRKNAEYVIKLEIFSSASLFIETYFYCNAGRKEYVDDWKEKRDLEFLGMPYYHGKGSFYHGSRRYRFIVLPRYGDDLQTKILNPNKIFSVKTAFTVALSVMDVLEYIHNRGYVHTDIKAANLVLDRRDPNKVYLIDFGLTYKIFNDDGRHKRLESDQRKAHDGTLSFTSRDAHIGAHSRRSDLEVLGYNIIKWISGYLPWESSTDAEQVADMKTKMMCNITDFLGRCFEECDTNPPRALIQYLNHVNALKFKDEPNYDYCRSLFRNAIRESGFKYDGKISFSASTSSKTKKRKHENSNKENNGSKKICNERSRKTLRSCNCRKTRNSTPITTDFDWPAILAGHPEKPNNTALPLCNPDPPTPVSEFMKDDCEPDDDNVPDLTGLDNPTPLMKQIMKLKRKVDASKNSATNVNSFVSENGTPCPSFAVGSHFRRKKKRFKPKRLNINRSSPLQRPTKCKSMLLSRSRRLRYRSHNNNNNNHEDNGPAKNVTLKKTGLRVLKKKLCFTKKKVANTSCSSTQLLLSEAVSLGNKEIKKFRLKKKILRCRIKLRTLPRRKKFDLLR